MFTNKKIGKKIIIAILIVLAFQFVLLKPVQADNVEFGGKLITPILSLLVTLSDGIMDIIGNAIMGASSSLYPVEMSNGALENILTAAVFLFAAAITVAAIVFTAGGVAAIASAILGKTIIATVGVGAVIAGIGAGIFAGVYYNDEVLPDDLYLPMYTYSAEEIFKGNILLFDVNFFNGNAKEIKAKLSDGTVLSLKDNTPQQIQDKANAIKIKKKVQGTTSKEEDKNGGEAEVSAKIEYYFYEENGQEIKTSSQNSATMLKKTISTWYNALRNICIVLMLSVLVYIGIRILLSSVASDKAKYMTMLKDWLVGLCLLFLMHYVMAFSVSLVERLTTVVKTTVGQNGYSVTMEANDKLVTAVDEEHLGQPDLIQESGGKKYLVWPTNLMGSLRLRLQMEDYGAQYIGLSICFIILCLFTLYFTVTYLKRVLHMAFLTLIAPMVALTYCIDKLNDGQAQGFNKWFKEYIFNLLIQPMHLLLYYILVTSAFEFASMNVIYSIVALGFMIPAEKLLRSLFGFEKAQTAPAMGPAGAMMASTALNHLLNRGKGGKGGGKDGGKGGSGSSDSEEGSVPNPREVTNPMGNYLGAGEEEPTQPSETRLPEGDLPEGDLPEGDLPEGDLPEIDPELPDPSGGIDPLADENGNGNYQYNNEDYEQLVRDSLGPDATEEEVQDALRDWYGVGLGAPEELDEDELQEIEEEQEPEENEEGRPSVGTRFRNKMNSTSFGRQVMRNLDANMAAQKASIRMAPDKIKNAIANSHPLKAAGKIAAGAALGTAAGAMGVAIASSTGEDGNLAKIGGAAAATGYAVGAGKAKNLPSASDDATVQDIYDNTYNKGQYKQDAMNDYVEKYKKNEKYRNYLETKFDAKTAKEMIEGGEIEEYLYNGINDIKDMAVMHKMQKDGVVKNRQEAIAVAQLNQMVDSDTTKMAGKKRADWLGRFREMAGQAGVAENNRDAFAKQRLVELDAFNNYKK